MQYKDFEGSAEIDTDTLVCRGKILFVDDLVTYKANSPADLVREFHAAVDDYLETCALVGKAPQKPCKGQFNVRVTPEQHRQAQRRATEDNTSLNAVVTSALEHYLSRLTHVDLHPKLDMPLVPTFSASGNVFLRPAQRNAVNWIEERERLTSTSGSSPSQTLQFNEKGGHPYVN
jgi:predicted HicB family RNase H-like nuclease